MLVRGIHIILLSVGLCALSIAITPVAMAEQLANCPVGGFSVISCPVLNDDVIRSAVTLRLSGSVITPENPIQVCVNNRVVVLSGEVQTEGTRNLATILASSVRGVERIDNLLVLSSTGNADLALVREVRNALARMPFSTRTIRVEAENGIVTLTGMADTEYIRTQAGLTAESVQGVTAVHNNVIAQEIDTGGGTF